MYLSSRVFAPDASGEHNSSLGDNHDLTGCWEGGRSFCRTVESVVGFGTISNF